MILMLAVEAVEVEVQGSAVGAIGRVGRVSSKALERRWMQLVTLCALKAIVALASIVVIDRMTNSFYCACKSRIQESLCS